MVDGSRTLGKAADAPRQLRFHIWAAWLAFAAITLCASRTDPDIWGHVRFGLDLLHTYKLPAVDPYSFTQDRDWINHEWLSEAAMAGAYDLAGTPGLILLKVAVLCSALSVLILRLRHSTALVAASAAGLAIVGMLPLAGTIRPQIWSVLGLALLMALLDYNRAPTTARIAAAAVVFAVWANLHGGWITGAAVLVAVTTIRAARTPEQASRWLLLCALALGATLVNPYGIGLWRFLAVTVRTSRPDISEWLPFSVHESPIIWASVGIPVVTVLALMVHKETRPSVEVLAATLLLVAGGLRVSRVAPLVVLPVLTLLAPWIHKAWGAKGRVTVPTASAAAVLAVPLVFAVAAAVKPVTRSFACLPISDSWAPDRTAAATLVGASGRLWTTFDWGEYAIWHFGPQLRVSIDGRRETVYSDDVVQWHREFDQGDPEAQRRFSQAMPEYVWLRSGSVAVRDWLIQNGYRVDVDTDRSFVAVRADLRRLPRGLASLPVCFP